MQNASNWKHETPAAYAIEREAEIERRTLALSIDPTRAQFADALAALLAPETLARLHALYLASGASFEARATFDNAVFEGLAAGFEAQAEIAYERALIHDEPLPLDAREVLSDWE